jgi:hypothetical protein
LKLYEHGCRIDPDKDCLGTCAAAAAAAAAVCSQAKSAGWTVQGDIVVLPANAFNTAVQKRTQDLIGFDAVAPVLKNTVFAV